MRYVAGNAKKWNGASSAARTRRAAPPPAAGRASHDEQHDRDQPGRPSVVARWGRKPVPSTTRSGRTASRPPSCCRTGVGDEASDAAFRRARRRAAHPAQAAAEADEDGRDGRDPAVAGQAQGERPDDQRQDRGEQRARREETGMMSMPAAVAAIAPWKSANQWYVRGSPAK